MQKTLTFFLLTLLSLHIFLHAAPVFAEQGSELVMDKVETVKAKVLEILDQEVRNVPVTDVQSY
jgi:hypothetical protein